ncbi:MAG: glycosyl transferase [Fibrobacteraceae bacterium]|nr:glycosyl transferase [Fibrobacteraceae bacterium]
MAIPKIIHYCWLSGEPYPELVQHCMATWKKHMPDYELRLWDQTRFDIHSVRWVEQAVKAKKWAFAADYIRLYALYNYGGIYLDSDVEVLKPFDDLLDLPYFLGKEHPFDIIDAANTVEVAAFGAEAHLPLLKKGLDHYNNRPFEIHPNVFDTTILPYIFSKIVHECFGTKAINNIAAFDAASSCIQLFPASYFSPKNTRTLEIKSTKNTYCIHHFNGSWHSKAQQKHVQARQALCHIFGEPIGEFIAAIYAIHIHLRYEGPITTLNTITEKFLQKIHSKFLKSK